MRTNKSIIIFGSSRPNGHTKKVIDEIIGSHSFPFINLNDLDISPFDYEHKNKDDDFIPLMEKILNHDTLIIATPVYWYQASAQHKIFFDRISDLLTIRKDLGKKLRGKKMFVIASFGTSYPGGFEETFELICNYLGIHYLGCSFIYSGTKNNQFLKNNTTHIENAKAVMEINT